VHKAVQGGGSNGGVAEVLSQSCATRRRSRSCWHGACSAAVEDAWQEQVVEHQQVELPVGAQHGRLLGGRGQCEVSKLGVAFSVTHVVPLQGRLVGHGLDDVVFTRAGLADDQGVSTLADELERVQLEAGLAPVWG
jgi:hypothetical protein